MYHPKKIKGKIKGLWEQIFGTFEKTKQEPIILLSWNYFKLYMYVDDVIPARFCLTYVYFFLFFRTWTVGSIIIFFYAIEINYRFSLKKEMSNILNNQSTNNSYLLKFEIKREIWVFIATITTTNSLFHPPRKGRFLLWNTRISKQMKTDQWRYLLLSYWNKQKKNKINNKLLINQKTPKKKKVTNEITKKTTFNF